MTSDTCKPGTVETPRASTSCRRVRRAVVAAMGFCLCLVVIGCAQVKPQAEFAQARKLIAESTGVEGTYDPFAPLLSEEEIQAFVADGLTADEAVRLALLNNRNLHAEFMAIGMAKADWVQSGLLSNPTLGLSAGFPEGGGLAKLEGSIARNIVDLWQIPTRKRIAQVELDATVLRIARLAGELAVETEVAYQRAVAAQRAYALARKNLGFLESTFEIMEAYLEAGTASELDLNLTRGEVISAEIDMQSARLEASNAKRRLARRLSIDADADAWVLTDGLFELPEQFGSAENLIVLARQSRLDLRALESAMKASAAAIGLEELNVFPEVTIGISGERGESRALPGRDILADTARASIRNGALTAPEIQPRSEREAARREEIETVLGPSLDITLPIFDQNQARIARARYQYEQDLKLYEALYLAVAQDIRIAVDEASTAAANAVKYRDQLIPQAERNLEFASESFGAGQTSFLEALEAQRVLLRALGGQINSELEAAVALAQLERTVGLSIDRLAEHASCTTQPGKEGDTASNAEPD